MHVVNVLQIAQHLAEHVEGSQSIALLHFMPNLRLMAMDCIDPWMAAPWPWE